MKLLVILLLLAAPCIAAEPVEVPLSEVWAWDMPRTRSVQELVTDDDSKQALAQFRAALRNGSGKSLPKGFAVQGSGVAALQAAALVISGASDRPKSLRSSEVTAVFYSTLFGAKVAIESVEETDSGARIRFRFLHDIDAHQTDHFALVPLSPSGQGKYTVEIQKLPISKSDSKAGYDDIPADKASRIVSTSFDVMIVEENNTLQRHTKEREDE